MLKVFTRILLPLLFISCSSTRITSRWHSDIVQPVHTERIMVLGVIRDSDRSIRENMERHLTEDLKARGFDAVSSYREFGPKVFEGLNEKETLDQLRNNQVNVVLTVVLLDKERERNYYRGYFYYSPFFYYYNNFWGYQMMMNSRIYQPGYYVTDTRYFWESNLYDLRTGTLLFSVQTQTFEPSSTEKMAHEYGEKITEALMNCNLIKPK
jgi:hypothetical protein